MNSIPLVKRGDANEINTALIAIRKQLQELTQLVNSLNDIESESTDMSEYIKKSSLTDSVESGNENPVTSGGVYTAIGNEANARNTAITDAIGTLDVTDTAVSGRYVSAVSETNGKITVTRADLPNTINNAKSLNGSITCSTAAGTAAKTVSLSGFILVKGAKLIVNLSNANTAQSALTLNVNNTGAKTIRWNGTVTSSSTYAMTATQYNCYYDGTYWNMDSAYEAKNARESNFANSSCKSRARQTFTCSTGASTVAKTVSVGSYTLSTRDELLIYFSTANTASNPTLNVNSTGAKPIKVFGTSPNSTNKLLKVGTYYCQYDGTNWNCYPYGVTNEISADNMQTVTSDAVAKALDWQLFTYAEAQTYFGFQMASGYSGNVGIYICVKNENLLLLSVFIDNISGTGIGTSQTSVIGTCNIRPKNNSDANYGAIAIAIDYKQTATQIRLGIFKDGRVAVMESKGVESGNNAIRGFFVIPI